MELARERRFDVYTGIDFWGRNTFGGGGFNIHKALRQIVKSETSIALFAPAWTFEFLGSSAFEINEERLWLNSKVEPVLPVIEKAPTTWPDPEDIGCALDYLCPRDWPFVHDSFYTNFDRGFGNSYFIRGEVDLNLLMA